jgi:hypothetical protein
MFSKIEKLIRANDDDSNCSHCDGECDGGDTSGPASGD